MEELILSLNDITLVGRATFCSILKLSFYLIRRYIVLYFLPKKTILLPTNHKIRGLIGSQDGANIPSSVPTSLQDPAINLYKSVVDFIYFRRLVEWALYAPSLGEHVIVAILLILWNQSLFWPATAMPSVKLNFKTTPNWDNYPCRAITPAHIGQIP